MGKIIWLASYPKSGNTWTRLVLANYRSGLAEPVDINHLGGVIASSHQLLDLFAGLDASELTPEEVAESRPLLYAGLAAYQGGDIFIKVHDAFTRTPGGADLFPAEATRGVVYLIRNPLDVAVSSAHHRGKSIQDTVDLLCRSGAIARGALRLGQMPQTLLSWSGHVQSWVDDSGLPVHVARYEDMVQAPLQTFAGIVSFSGLDLDESRLRQAVEFTRFDRLQAQEAASGFREKPARSASFFRKGRVGSWREELTPAQADQIITAHRDMMGRFGYFF